MSSKLKIGILIIFFMAVGAIVAFKNQFREIKAAESSIKPVATVEEKLPKLIDLGSHNCILCKMIMPILDTLWLAAGIFAFMAPVLAVTFVSGTGSIFSSSLILAFYGIGYTLLIVLAGTFTGALRSYLKWNSEKGHTDKIKKNCWCFFATRSSLLFSKVIV